MDECRDCTVSVNIKRSLSDTLCRSAKVWRENKEIMKTTSTIALGIMAVLMLQTKVVFPLAEAEMDPFTSDEAETELEPAEVETELEQMKLRWRHIMLVQIS